MGFWSVFALVTGSQIGSSILMSPANLAHFGIYAVLGYFISGIGAIALALVFAQLCAWLPQTGGPHVYIEHTFGRFPAFLVGWTYWVISWVSSTILVITGIGYLLPLLQISSPFIILALEIALLCAMLALNLRGVAAAGRMELILSLLKFIPLLVIPVSALAYFDYNNFMLDASLSSLSFSTLISRVTLLTLWGFIGLETATTAAGSVENPSVTIPKAVVTGTACVALLYILNSLALMGTMPGNILAQSNAPYVDVSRIVFGGNWHLIIAIIAVIACIGTLNAWVLTSGQIALGLARDRLLPLCFGITNRYGAPIIGLAISVFGMIPLLIMVMQQQLATQVLTIIDISVTSFLFVYLACCLSFFRLLFRHYNPGWRMFIACVYGFIALLFCSWIIYQTEAITLLITCCFTLSGLPCYWWLQRRRA
jgi:APA family basic amino acid/polyamine antiporter